MSETLEYPILLIVHRLWKRSELKKRYFIVLVKSSQPRSVLSSHKKQRIVIPPVISTAALDNDSKKRKHIVFDEVPDSQEGHQDLREEETGEARKKKVKFETTHKDNDNKVENSLKLPPPKEQNRGTNNSNNSHKNSNKNHQNKKKLRREKS